jgi:hypothetical protein
MRHAVRLHFKADDPCKVGDRIEMVEDGEAEVVVQIGFARVLQRRFRRERRRK